MVRLHSFAEVVGSAVLTAQLDDSGESPGRPLSEYLDLSSRSSHYVLPLIAADRQRLHQLAAPTENPHLEDIEEISVSLERLSHLDAESTRVRVGYSIDYSLTKLRRWS